MFKVNLFKDNMFLNYKESKDKKDCTIKQDFLSPKNIIKIKIKKNKSNLIVKDKHSNTSLVPPIHLSNLLS